MIKEKRSIRPEARTLARQQAIKEAKEKRVEAETKKKAEKGKAGAKGQGGAAGAKVSKLQSKGAPTKVKATTR